MTQNTRAAIVEFSYGEQKTVNFDHAPQINTVVRVPGTDTYARVIAVFPLKTDKATGAICS